MALLLREAHHLVLDGGAVAGAHAFDDAGVHRRLVDGAADDRVRLFVGVGDVTGALGQGGRRAVRGEGEERRRVVALLGFQAGIIDGVAVQARHGAGLHPAHGKAGGGEPPGQAGRGYVAQTAGREVLETNVDEAVEKGAGGHDHGPDAEDLVQRGADADHPAALDQDFIHHRLADSQVRLVFQHPLHAQPVEQPVGLGAGGTHRRALAGVEAAELDAGGIDVLGHFPAQGVDLLDQVALGQAADGRVAGHGADGVGVDDADERPAAHARRGQGRLAAGVAGADYGNVKISHVLVPGVAVVWSGKSEKAAACG